jgi:hypothetical protein
LKSEGEALLSRFDFELDFLSDSSDPQISAKYLVESGPAELPEEIILALTENRLEDIGYNQTDYLLWLTGEIEVTDNSSHSPNE